MYKDSLQTAVSHVKQQYSNARIILFGSNAKGTDSEESDIDLCIVIDKPSERLRDISRKIRREIYPILNKPIDLFVYDKQTFDDRASLPVTMEAEITENGKEL